MFETLERQYINKLVKSKVRDFASPKTFHCVKVECLGHDGIKPSAEVSRTFVVPVLALIGNRGVKPCELTDGTPIVVRAFDLSADGFVEFAELVQGVFQGLWMLDFLACIECQIRLHPEVYPYTFTCSGQNLLERAICDNIQPILTSSIPADLDIPDVPFPIAVMVIQDITLFENKLLFHCIPFFERQANCAFWDRGRFIVFRVYKNLVACLELRRTEFAAPLELRGTDTSAVSAFFYPIKEPLVGDMDTDNYRIKRIPRYPCPVGVGAFEQLRQVRLQAIPASVFTIDTVISLLHCQEVVMDIFKVIEHVTQAHILWVIPYLFFVRSAILFSFFHGFSRLTSLTPTQWVGRHATLRLRCVCLPT